MDELSPNGRRRVYRALLRVARADERMDPSEVSALRRIRDELGLSPAEARELEAEPPGEPLRVGKSVREREILARRMAEVAAADGELDARELKLLTKLARAIGFPEERLETVCRRALSDARSGVGDEADLEEDDDEE